MSTLSREYALSRTGIALFLSLLILALFAFKWSMVIVCAVIMMVYYFSCQKQASKIVELMEGKKPTKAKRRTEQRYIGSKR